MAMPEFILERRFNAPRDMVWRTWTEPELLARWYGPGVETVVHKLDVQPGGLWLNEMKFGSNSHFQRVEYTEVVAPEKLVWLHSVSDGEWNVVSNPMMPDWPKVLLTTVTFSQTGDHTDVRLVWTPHEANEAEIACFADAIDGLDKGWGAGMDLLAEMLAEMQRKV